MTITARRQLAIGLALLAVSTAPALAQDTSGGAMRHQDKAGESKADAEFHRGMIAMQHEMSGMKMTGDADQDFVAMMIPHHRGAVDMAGWS
jgi:uncharacterized protein (DUF305 family)